MWREPDDFAEQAGLRMEGNGVPAEAESAELAQGRGNEIEGFTTVGALADAIVGRLRDRAARNAPRIGPVAPAGSVAQAGRRRQIE